jgi:hypothetical protein
MYASNIMQWPYVLDPFLRAAGAIGRSKSSQGSAALHSLLVATQSPGALLGFILLVLSALQSAASTTSDRFCDPLLMAHVSIDQRSSHCLDSSWQVPSSSMVTLHFTVSRCIPSSRNLIASSVNTIGGYAVLSEGIFLLKRFHRFGPADFNIPLNDSFVLPRFLADRAQPIPLEILLFDDDEGLSSR